MSTIALSSLADTYVQQRQPNMNLSKRGRLVVGAERQPQNTYRSLLKFELSQLPSACEIIGATLKLFVERATLSSCISVAAYGIAPDYDPSVVTWDTAPQTTEPSAAFTVSYCQAKQFIEADVTELVRRSRTDSSPPLLGILLTESAGDPGSAVFAAGSDRDARYRPSLIIQYTCGDSEATVSQSAAIPQAAAAPQAEQSAPVTPAYGGLYHTALQRISISENGMQPIALGETMPHRNMMPGAHTLAVHVAGDYAIRFTVLPRTEADAFPINAGVLINGRISSPALCVSGVCTAECSAMTAAAIVTLAAGDVLGLGLSSPSGGSAVLGPGLHASLSVARLG